MEALIFLKGIAVGLIICAPVGPIGIICVRRTILDGPVAGMLSVLGASTADGLYCAIAGLGVAYVSNFLKVEHTLIKTAGGLILIFWGIKTFFASTGQEEAQAARRSGLLGAYTSTLLLTLTNLLLILVYSAAFAALGVHGWRSEYLSTGLLVLGVFCGSALWSPILVTAVEFFRPKFDPSQIRLVNKTAGLMIIGFGVLLEIATIF